MSSLHSLAPRNFRRVYKCHGNKKGFPNFVFNLSEDQVDFEESKTTGGGDSGVVNLCSACREKHWKRKNVFFQFPKKHYFLFFSLGLALWAKKRNRRFPKKTCGGRKPMVWTILQTFIPNNFFEGISFIWKEIFHRKVSWLWANSHWTIG